MTPKDPALEVMQHCIGMRSRAVARAISRQFDDALRPLGVTGGQFTILVAGSLAAPRSITAFADLMDMERSGLTRNLQLLAKAGYVTLGESEDSRARAVAVTSAGRDLVAQGLPLWRAAQARIAERLGEEGTASIHASFQALMGPHWPRPRPAGDGSREG